MLSRRYLRIRVLQSLYSYFQGASQEVENAEKQLFSSVEKIYDLYLMYLAILPQLAKQGELQFQKVRNFPKKEDSLLPVFFNHPVMKALEENIPFKDLLKKRVAGWAGEDELMRKIFTEVRKAKPFRDFLTAGQSDFSGGIRFFSNLLQNHVATSPSLLNYIEERNLFWENSAHWMGGIAAKSLEKLTLDPKKNFLSSVFKDEEDKEFIRTLFYKTILESEFLEKEISGKTRNWDVERIALMDIIIMKMALAELIYFPFIPVKVTINEYLDIAKEYSSPGSHAFINGIIDNLAISMKESGKIAKKGPGLLEG